MTLPQGPLGYAIEKERKFILEEHGQDPNQMLMQFKDSFPKTDIQANPLGAVDILNQGNQGSCQGHSLALIFSICFFLATGRKAAFSRAAAYYLSQEHDGINGDQGSTLSGGQKVATEGLCLETDWTYPSSYNPRRPATATPDKFSYKLNVSRPLKTRQEVEDWLRAGLPIQTGLSWGPSCNEEVVDNWTPGGGGHSTTLWLLSGEDPNNLNSWGNLWNKDGMQKWTWRATERILAHRWTVLMGYAPDKMSFPDQDPIG